MRFQEQEWTDGQIKDNPDERPFQEENVLWNVHYWWRNFLLYKEKSWPTEWNLYQIHRILGPDPLNEICIKSIGF